MTGSDTPAITCRNVWQVFGNNADSALREALSRHETAETAAQELRGKGLIPAWLEVLPLMRPGDEWIITVPPEMGYGESGQGPIPPNSVLIFRIELIDVLPGPGRVQRG